MTKAVVINLWRRPDRFSRFMADASRSLPSWIAVERFAAIDGLKVIPPVGWRGESAGHWGCLRSHAAVLKQALDDGLTELMVFEDDCLFAEDFASKLSTFLELVPKDWEALMLGGRHVEAPITVSGEVVRVKWVHRTHAYWLRNRETMLELLKTWRTSMIDLDNSWKEWQERFLVFAPSPFLCGQSTGKSDVSKDCSEHFKERWD